MVAAEYGVEHGATFTVAVVAELVENLCVQPPEAAERANDRLAGAADSQCCVGSLNDTEDNSSNLSEKFCLSRLAPEWRRW